MCVGTANKALSERVDAGFLLERETILKDVSHHIAAMEAGDVDGESTIGPHLSVHTAQHREVVGWNLLEVTELIFGVDAHSG